MLGNLEFCINNAVSCWCALAGTVADYTDLSEEQFWQAMARRNYLWPYAANGQRVDVQMLPKVLPKTVAGACPSYTQHLH